MPGPLPKPPGARRRRNAPTIPATKLPLSGRPGPVPRAPKTLAAAGLAWWKWAWKTPQAAAWDPGSTAAIARRAHLEDLSAVLASVDGELPEDRQALIAMITTLKSIASGELAVVREMRELDDRFGLTPKARLALRWEFEEDAPKSDESPGLTVVPDAWRNAASS